MRTLVRSQASKDAELAELKARALDDVIARAREIRLMFVTELPGQELIYAEKRAEAIAFVAATPVPTDLTSYPFIAAEVGITAQSAEGVAQVYLNLSQIWLAAGVSLEAIRLGAAQAIDAAVSQAEIDAAMATFHSNLEALQ